MSEESKNPVVRRIQKLLALAGHNTNEHEAKAAAEMAHRLLLEHNLNMQTVKAAGGETGDEYVKHTGYHARVRTTEQKFIFGILQQFFFIKVVHSRQERGGPVTFFFIGTRTNVDVAQYVHDFLIYEYKALWLDYKRAEGLPQSARQSYYAGLTAGLELQLRASRKQVETSRALVLVQDPHLQEFTNQAFGNKLSTSSGYRMRLDDEKAMDDGIEAGRQLRIRKGLTADRTGTGAPLALGDGRRKI